MRIGVKPGQIGLTINELRRSWREAEDAGFESVWVFDHLTRLREQLCYEAVSLLAAMATATTRVRIGAMVLPVGTRQAQTLAASLATIDALSNGRLEIGLGAGSAFASQDFEALGIAFGSFERRFAQLTETVDRIVALTGPRSPLGARPVQTPIPLILGGRSRAIRELAIKRGLAWNLSTDSPEEFARLKSDQRDPQAQIFLRDVPDVPDTVAQFRDAGATRLIFVLEPPIEAGSIARLAVEAGL